MRASYCAKTLDEGTWDEFHKAARRIALAVKLFPSVSWNLVRKFILEDWPR